MIAKGDGTYRRLLNQLAKVDLLILDDWGLAPLNAAESREILEVLDDRILRSTCVASQLPLHLWHQHFADSTVADAVLDRLIHTAHKIQMQGESMRKLRNSLPTKSENDI